MQKISRATRFRDKCTNVAKLYSPRRAAADLALLAREAPDTCWFRREVLSSCQRLMSYDTAVFSEAGHGDVTTVDVDRRALELIGHCERNFHCYQPDLRKGLE